MSSSDFRDTLLELMDTSPGPMDHPSPDRWLAYHRGELPADEEERLQEHLARCRDCFDLAAGAADFAQPDEGEEADTNELWRLLRPQLDSPAARQNVREIAAGPRRQSSRGGRLPYALAASFFVALVASSVWNLQLKSALEAIRAPQPDVVITDFSDGERLPTSGERTLTANTGPWVFVFHPSEELPVYRLALRDGAAGGELWTVELRPDGDRALTLQLVQGLRPGRYRLELSDGSGGGAGKVLEIQLLRVIAPDRGE